MTSIREACTGGDLDPALEEFRSIVGAQFVQTGADAARRGTSTIGIERDVPAVVLPGSEEEVVAVVKAALRHRTPLYPVSTGKNWGYGCAAPTAEGCVVVELSRMRRLSVDPVLGTATLGPGVTTEQLWARLREESLPFMVPVTGAGPTTSIVGNALEARVRRDAPCRSFRRRHVPQRRPPERRAFPSGARGAGRRSNRLRPQVGSRPLSGRAFLPRLLRHRDGDDDQPRPASPGHRGLHFRGSTPKPR